MTEEIERQTLSALLDGEISEIDLHRLLRQYKNDPSLKDAWLVYAQIRHVLQGKIPDKTQLDLAQQLSLHERISAEIAAEPTYELAVTPNHSHWVKPVASLAVAASLVIAVLIGLNLDGATEHENDLAQGADRAVTPTSQTVVLQPAETTLIDSQLAQLPDAFNEQASELKVLDMKKQRQLRAYLLKHDQMARLNTYPQTVNYQQSGKN